MTEIIAISASILSIFAAILSLWGVMNLRRDVKAIESTLSSKGGILPPSPDVEDPEGKDNVAQIYQDDEGDR